MSVFNGGKENIFIAKRNRIGPYIKTAPSELGKANSVAPDSGSLSSYFRVRRVGLTHLVEISATVFSRLSKAQGLAGQRSRMCLS